MNRPIYKFKDWIELNKIDYTYLSKNPNAIDYLKENPDKINWSCLCVNPNPLVMEILEKNLDKKI